MLQLCYHPYVVTLFRFFGLKHIFTLLAPLREVLKIFQNVVLLISLSHELKVYTEHVHAGSVIEADCLISYVRP